MSTTNIISYLGSNGRHVGQSASQENPGYSERKLHGEEQIKSNERKNEESGMAKHAKGTREDGGEIRRETREGT